MIKIKKKHISEAKKTYKGNEKSFIRGVPYFKNITKEEKLIEAGIKLEKYLRSIKLEKNEK